MMGYTPRFGVTEIVFSLIFGFIIITIIVFSVVKILQTTQGKNINSRYNPTIRSDPMDILKERYAKGIISDEEYQQKKSILEKDRWY